MWPSPPHSHNDIGESSEPNSWHRSVKRKYEFAITTTNCEGGGGGSVDKLRPRQKAPIFRPTKPDNSPPHNLYLEDAQTDDGSFSKGTKISSNSPASTSSSAGRLTRNSSSLQAQGSSPPIISSQEDIRTPRYSLHASRVREILKLKELIKSQKEALDNLYIELEDERNASATSADEAMAMILRLQEEKSILQMENRQYKRMAEERSSYDQETIDFLRELLTKREEDITYLEEELEAHKKQLLRYETDSGTHEQIADNCCEIEGSSPPASPLSRAFVVNEYDDEQSHCETEEVPIARQTPPSLKYESEEENEPVKWPFSSQPDDAQEASESAIWDRIRRLEERLNYLGETQAFQNQMPRDKTTLPYNNCSEESGEKVHDVFEVEHGVEAIIPEHSRPSERSHNEIEEIPTGNYDMQERQEISEISSWKTIPSSNEVRSRRVEIDNSLDMGKYESSEPTVELVDEHTKAVVVPNEVQELTNRLQSLERERLFMTQAVDSLKRENTELRLLQDIAQQLRELKGDVSDCKHTSKGSLQQREFRMPSVFRGILSLIGLIGSEGAQNRRLPHLSEGCSEVSSYHGNRVGLMHLLKDPFPSMPACVTRGLKVLFPVNTNA